MMGAVMGRARNVIVSRQGLVDVMGRRLVTFVGVDLV
jgi:hypothetical protein